VRFSCTASSNELSNDDVFCIISVYHKLEGSEHESKRIGNTFCVSLFSLSKIITSISQTPFSMACTMGIKLQIPIILMIILGNQDIKGRGEEAQVQSQNHHVTIIRIKIFNRIQSEI
jgi:hypothetical protein